MRNSLDRAWYSLGLEVYGGGAPCGGQHVASRRAGLQRAKKGVRFVEFPGVLQVTLWRGVDKTWVALPPQHILTTILFNNNTPLRIKIVLSGSTGV